MQSSRGLITIYYGSTNGNSAAQAFQLASELESLHFLSDVVNLGDFDVDSFLNSKLCIFMLSTYGSGGPTKDAEQFFEWLQNSNDDLSNLQYAVLGFGNKNYSEFCGMACKCEAKFNQLKAKQIGYLGKCCAQSGNQLEEYMKWSKVLFEELAKYPLTNQQVKISKAIVNDSSEPGQLNNYGQQYLKAHNSLVKEIKVLRKADDSFTLFVNLDSSDYKYQTAGDVGVYPENIDYEEFAQYLGLNLQQKFSVSGKVSFPTPITVEDYLKKFCDYNRVNSRILYELYKISKKEELLKLCQDKFELNKKMKGLSLLDVLKSYQIKQDLMPTFSARLYTIASSALKHKNELHLIASSVRVTQQKYGVCSRYLHQNPKSVKLFVQESEFKMPKNPQAPIVLVGAGAGLAPLRGMIHERDYAIETDQLEQSNFQGGMKLYFGCRSQKDELFREEHLQFLELGTLSDYVVSYSREEGKEKQYVQSLLDEKEMYDHFYNKQGMMYYCGSESMGRGIFDKLTKMFEKLTTGYVKVKELEKNGLIQKEIFE